MIPTYRVLYQFYGEFLHICYISLYLKEILFTCVIYAATFYHHSECGVPGFVCPNSCCDLGRGGLTWFQVFDKLEMDIFSCLGQVVPSFFVQACLSYTFPLIVLELCDIQCKFICDFEWMSLGKNPLCPCIFI